MKKLKLKILVVIAIIGIFTIGMPILSYGTNENIVVVKEAENEYIIYIEECLDKEFEFAFSNNASDNIDTLHFIPSAVDTANGTNNIAYVDSTNIAMFTNETYMWVKIDGEIKISAREIDIKDNITKMQLENTEKISKTIPIELGQEQIVNTVNAQGTKITETVGIVKLLNELTNAQYQLIKRPTAGANNDFFALAELLEKNEFTDTYTQIKASKEFVKLYDELYNSLNSEDWKTVENLKIEQPVEAETGDQYILWLKGDNIQDVHFLTSFREYEEDYIKEEITTKLPYTYDNNIVLVILGIVIVAIIVVSIRIAMLKKKEMSK